MDRFITHQGDISLWQIDKKGIASLAKFVVEENFMHHEGKMLSSCESSEEYHHVLQEEQAFYEYSSIIVAKNTQGDIIGAIRIACWDKNPHTIPLVKLFGDHLIDLEQLRHDHKHLWHIGRFAINRNYTDNGRLFKLLMLYAISPIFRYNRGVLLAEIDQKLLRTLGALHIQASPLSKGISYLGSTTIPITIYKEGLDEFMLKYAYLAFDIQFRETQRELPEWVKIKPRTQNYPNGYCQDNQGYRTLQM